MKVSLLQGQRPGGALLLGIGLYITLRKGKKGICRGRTQQSAPGNGQTHHGQASSAAHGNISQTQLDSRKVSSGDFWSLQQGPNEMKLLEPVQMAPVPFSINLPGITTQSRKFLRGGSVFSTAETGACSLWRSSAAWPRPSQLPCVRVLSVMLRSLSCGQ